MNNGTKQKRSEESSTSHEGQSGAFVDSSDSRLSVQLFDAVHGSCVLHLSRGCLNLQEPTDTH